MCPVRMRYAGMADVHVPDDHVNALIERLQTITDPGQVDEALADFDQPGGSLLSTESPWINYAFGLRRSKKSSPVSKVLQIKTMRWLKSTQSFATTLAHGSEGRIRSNQPR